MDFDLTDLRLFAAVAREENLTRAAQVQHLSLAAASARVKALEQQAGVALLERKARGVRLLPAGEAFLHHVRAVLREAQALRDELDEYGAGLRGHVRVFANTTAVTDFLPEILPVFFKSHPGVNIDLREKPNTDIATGVLEGRADVGIVAGEVDTRGLRAIHFSTDKLVLVVPRGHRLARRKRVAFADTLAEDAVGMHGGSTLQAFLSNITEELGRPLKLRIQVYGFDAMCRMIAAGVGVGIVPESAAARNIATMDLVQVELTDTWRIRKRYIVVRSGDVLATYARSLVQTICAHYGCEVRI
jgi:DNA-binding transcriptional LysR family regulator